MKITSIRQRDNPKSRIDTQNISYSADSPSSLNFFVDKLGREVVLGRIPCVYLPGRSSCPTSSFVSVPESMEGND